MSAFALLLFLVLAILSPLLFGRLMLASLEKLHLDPATALTLAIAMFVGGLINIPIANTTRQEHLQQSACYLRALRRPQLARNTTRTVIAINLGGCVIPAGLSLYEIAYLALHDSQALLYGMVGCCINIIVCYFVARPVQGVGIAMPAFVSPFAAASLALLLVPEAAPPAAFVIGVTGPLVGADLLHMKDVRATETGVASIGGAGTFDGIVLSGIIAAYLA